jgi:hypothetical protein
VAMTLTVHDRTVDGTALGELTLELLTERTTVRELIRSRVYQEVTEHNARRVSRWAGLVQLDPDAVMPPQGQAPRRVDWEAQVERATRAFTTGTLLIMADGRQAETLDDEIEVRVDSTVDFLRLMPLIGG